MGVSLVKSRVMETMLLYVIDTMNSKFVNVKEMMMDTIMTERGHWYTCINKHREELGVTWDELLKMSKEELKKKIRKYDTDKWYESLETKPTLKYYHQGKAKFGYDFCYKNNHNSTFLARARTNALKLGEQKSRGNPHHDVTCRLCKEGKEDMVHFLIDCKELEEDRNYSLIDSSLDTSENKMIKLLFDTEDFQGTGYMIKKLWLRRKALLQYIKKTEEEKKEKKRKIPPVPIIYQMSDPGPVRRGHDFLGGRSLRNTLVRG